MPPCVMKNFPGLRHYRGNWAIEHKKVIADIGIPAYVVDVDVHEVPKTYWGSGGGLLGQ